MDRIPNAYRLAQQFDRVLENAGEFAVYAHLVFGWWDRVRSAFGQPDPIVEVEASADPAETRLHLGGAASPRRENEEPLTLRAFTSALHALAPDAADALYASLSFELTEGDETFLYVMNVPVRSMRVTFDRKRERVLLQIRGVRRAPPS